jgi:hypothetical protein
MRGLHRLTPYSDDDEGEKEDEEDDAADDVSAAAVLDRTAERRVISEWFACKQTTKPLRNIKFCFRNKIMKQSSSFGKY